VKIDVIRDTQEEKFNFRRGGNIVFRRKYVQQCLMLENSFKPTSESPFKTILGYTKQLRVKKNS
jgi:hypothetical protein